MLLRPTFFFFFLFFFLKVTNSCRISSATHVAERPRAVLEQRAWPLPRYLLSWEFSVSVWHLKKLMNAVGYYSEVPPLPVMAMSQSLKKACCRV